MKLLPIAKSIYGFTKKVFTEFVADDCLTMSAALSYYMTFSLAPILFILVLIAGFFFGEDAVSGQIYISIRDVIGSRAAEVAQSLIKAAYINRGSTIATLISIATVLIGATTVFSVLHNSLNRIWKVTTQKQQTFYSFFKQRMLGMLMVLSIGVLLIVFIIAEEIINYLQVRLEWLLAYLPKFINSLSNKGLTFSLILLLFTAVFKILSDARISLRTCFVGALVTALLFALGRSGISYYLVSSNLSAIYGAAGSLAVLLTWVYYSSAIFFLGAQFIKVYAEWLGEDMNA